MKKNIAIEVKNLSKMYKIYREPKYLLKEILFRRKFHEEFWALKKINFNLYQGEVVGIIGRNGAGKSTLLKILAGTLDKTSGNVKINGKVSAILEIGTGFHPEYTGRENIYNGGLILGMSKKEINSKIDSIIEFSELGEFIDRPFKTYSSGMQVRLSFSVATAINPEVLIIDEALAAGDIYFMGKCMAKIKEICERKNVTVLFVSHNTYIVQRLCNRTIWLEEGKIQKLGQTLETVKSYETLIRNMENDRLKKEDVTGNKKIFQKQLIPSLKGIKIKKVSIIDKNNKVARSFKSGDKMKVRIYFKADREFDNLSFCLEIYRNDGIIILSSNSSLAYNDNFVTSPQIIGPILKGEGYVDIIFKQIYLGTSQYLISVGIFPVNEYMKFYDWHDRMYKFRVFREGHPLTNTVEFVLKYNLRQEV